MPFDNEFHILNSCKLQFRNFFLLSTLLFYKLSIQLKKIKIENKNIFTQNIRITFKCCRKDKNRKRKIAKNFQNKNNFSLGRYIT